MTQPFHAESTRARTAQLRWDAAPVRERLTPVRRLRSLLVECADDLAEAVHADVFRDREEVITSDVLPSAAALKFLTANAPSLLKPRRAARPPLWLMGCRDVIHRRPFGVAGVIGTWNYPLFLNIVPIVQAAVAGNAVLWKPSEQTPRTTEVLSRLFADAGFPADVIQTLPATREGGPQLAEAAIDFVQFTGSEGVGRALARRLGERLIPSTLELSGVDACIVLPDADPQFAARAVAFGISLNGGQTCIAVRRVYVADAIYGAFVDALVPLIERCEPKSLVIPSELDRLTKLRKDARDQGAKVIPEQLHDRARPTVLLDPPSELPVDTDACFCPIATVKPFAHIDEVVARHNQCRFGLGGSIFTNDRRSGEALARRLNTGMVIINDLIAPTAHPATPFGGRGASGWGATQGAEGLLAFTTPQVITSRSGRFRPHFDAKPGDAAMADTIRGLLAFSHACGFGARCRGLVRMIRGMMRYGRG